MAAISSTGTASAAGAIRVEPMASAVGLWINGVDLNRLDASMTAMIQDMWQLGGALLFRDQETPAAAGRNLAAALAGGPVAAIGAAPFAEIAITEKWQMAGAGLVAPPKALVFAPDGASQNFPALLMAGMEAAADTMRMEDPEFLDGLAGQRCAHTEQGPEHPLLVRHPLSGEACLYPPPDGCKAFANAERLLAYAAETRFCWRYICRPGDVLALDPRAVRCRWAELPDPAAATFLAVPGTIPLNAAHAGFNSWE